MRRLVPALTGLASLGMLSVRAEPQLLKQDEVEQIVAQAAAKASDISPNSIIAVTDRDGFILAIWDCGNKVPTPLPQFAPPFVFPPPKGDQLSLSVIKTYSLVAGAITRASTAAFLSSDQNAFTTRTAGFIIQQHFPPGVRNTPSGPLVGVGFSSLFFSDVNRAKLIPPGFNGAVEIPPTISPGVRAPLFPLTSLNDSPGGVPLYKGGKLVGGLGVVGDDSPTNLAPAGAIFFKETQREATPGFKYEDDTDELVALAGQSHFRPDDSILATNAFINGIRLPYVNKRPEDIQDVDDVPPLGRIGRPIDVPIILAGTDPGSAVLIPGARDLSKSVVLANAYPNQTVPFGTIAPGYPQAAPKAYPYEVARLGGFEGQIRFPFRDDPWMNHGNPRRRKINGKASRLSKSEVKDIISLAAQRARITRAGIRLPLGTNMKVFITVVANPDRPSVPPPILGVFGTGEATIFSWDVAVQKARTAIFFSNTQLAMSSRTIGFLAQRFFPPGIDGTAHGPYFGFQEATSLRSSALTAFFPGDPNLPNGITIFPGGFPLYRDGYLVGAVGVSGDGVDQDDIVSISGTEDFRPKVKIRADNYSYRGARLPFAKFPRDPVR